MTQLARRMGIFGVALVLALTLGTASVGAQDLSTVGRIVSTNSPEYRQITGQARAQDFSFNCGFYGGNCFSNGLPYGYYGGQQFAYYGGTPYYGGQQFAYNGGVPYYGGTPYYAPGYNTFGYAVPDQFFRAVGCEVGNYSCYYNQVGFPR